MTKRLLDLWRFIGNWGFILGLVIFSHDDLPWGFEVPILGKFRYAVIGMTFWWYLHGQISSRVFHLVKPKWYSEWQYPPPTPPLVRGSS